MKKIISSLFYKFVESFAVKGIGLLISIVLARLISPEDFGQIAIITVFINLSTTFIQSGLNSALIQKKDVEERDYSTVFYISISTAILIIGLLYICSPVIADYYNSDALILPLRIYAFSLLFGAFNSVQIAKLQREMKFKLMMYCNLISTVVSGIVGIGAAFFDLGIWALVIYYFSHTAVSCITMIFISRWLPRFVFSVRRTKVLFSYGWKILVSSLLCTLYYDVRSLIIGKKFSTKLLGFYNRGQQLPNIVSHTTDTAIQSVMFPTLSYYQDDKTQLKMMLKRSMTTGSLIIFPAMAGIAAVAESLITILFGKQWLNSVIYMQIICIAEAQFPITSSNLIAIKSLGRSDIYMKLEVIRRITMIIILVISVVCFNSVKAIAIGYAISTWIDVVIVTIPMKKIIGYGIIEQTRDIWKIILTSIIVFFATMLVGKFITTLMLRLCLQIIIGVVMYILLCYLLRIESFNYILKIIKAFKNKRYSR